MIRKGYSISYGCEDFMGVIKQSAEAALKAKRTRNVLCGIYFHEVNPF